MSIISVRICASSLRFKGINILHLNLTYLRKVGQVHGVKFLQWPHSVSRFKIYKRLSNIFYASSHRFRDVNILNVWPSKSRSRSQSTSLAMKHLIVNVKIYNWLPHIFALAHTVWKILIFILLPSKCRSRSRSTSLAWYHSMANVKIFKWLPHIIE